MQYPILTNFFHISTKFSTVNMYKINNAFSTIFTIDKRLFYQFVQFD